MHESFELGYYRFSGNSLKNFEKLQIAGYRWFGQNRESIHRKAKWGSGGVGFLVKEHILNEFDCKVLNDATEGILWLKFTHKLNNYSFLTVYAILYHQILHTMSILTNILIIYCAKYLSTRTSVLFVSVVILMHVVAIHQIL